MVLNFAKNNRNRCCILILTGEELLHSSEVSPCRATGARRCGLQPCLCPLQAVTMGGSLVLMVNLNFFAYKMKIAILI